MFARYSLTTSPTGQQLLSISITIEGFPSIARLLRQPPCIGSAGRCIEDSFKLASSQSRNSEDYMKVSDSGSRSFSAVPSIKTSSQGISLNPVVNKCLGTPCIIET